MNDMQVFTNPEFGQLRTVNIDGRVWAVIKEVPSLVDSVMRIINGDDDEIADEADD